MTQRTLASTVVSSPEHVLGMADLQGAMERILDAAHRLKAMHAAGPLPPLLQGKAVLLVFAQSSTRTRVSFEIGIQRLGGIVTSLDADSSQMARGESLEDTAQVLSRYADAIAIRAKRHSDVQELAAHATVPVINALTELEHPCQVLADWMALQEAWGGLRGRTFAFVGDGNNMCHSYLMGAAMAGMDIHVATPPGHGPAADVVEQAEVIAHQNGSSVTVGNDPAAAVAGADAVATDTWTSMGDEDEAVARRGAFDGYRVDETLLGLAAPDARFLHCLPGHWGEEATHAVAHGSRSLIYEQAEARMWVQMALLCDLLGVRRVG